MLERHIGREEFLKNHEHLLKQEKDTAVMNKLKSVRDQTEHGKLLDDICLESKTQLDSLTNTWNGHEDCHNRFTHALCTRLSHLQ